MYELTVEIKDKVIISGIFENLDELQNYIYFLEKHNRKDNNNRIYKINSLLPGEKIVINFD